MELQNAIILVSTYFLIGTMYVSITAFFGRKWDWDRYPGIIFGIPFWPIGFLFELVLIPQKIVDKSSSAGNQYRKNKEIKEKAVDSGELSIYYQPIHRNEDGSFEYKFKGIKK